MKAGWIALAGLLAYANAAAAQNVQWGQLPRMKLERQFAGPLKDTVIQRWRDPADGTLCFVYLPMAAQHFAPGAAGYVQYAGNSIGSISCMAGPAEAATAATPGGLPPATGHVHGAYAALVPADTPPTTSAVPFIARWLD